MITEVMRANNNNKNENNNKYISIQCNFRGGGGSKRQVIDD